MTDWPTTTRAAIAKRAKQGFGTGLYKVPYSQERLVDGGRYRADCSGFVCRALGLTSAVGHGWWGGLNTVTLVTSGAVRRIEPDDLRQGDVCGNMGAGTAGDDGHTVIFDRWSNDDPNDSHHWIWEQCGGTTGPIHREIDWPYPGEGNAWKAYRYVGLNEGNDMPTVKEVWQTDGVVPAPQDSASYDKNKTWTAGNSLGEAVRASRSTERMLRAWIASQDPKKLAAALAVELKALGVGSAVTDAQLDASLHRVLGSLDEAGQ